MQKYVPYEKLSKRKKRELDRQRRGDWGLVNPVTRKVESAKAYARNKRRRLPEDGGVDAFLAPIFTGGYRREPATRSGSTRCP